MNAGDRGRFFRQALLAVWAMATVVLALCVILLAREMTQRGHNPFTLPKAPAPSSSAQADKAAADGTRSAEGGRSPGDITLYFASSDGRVLEPEVRRFERSAFTAANCRAALDALIAGPQTPLTPILPSSAKVRAVYLLADGELVVDFARELVEALPRSASTEILMAYGVVNTLTQPALQGDQEPAVRVVRFLVEGSAPEEAFETHLDFSGPIAPNPRWISAGEAVVSSNG